MFFPDPVTNQALTILRPTADISGNTPVDDNCHCRERCIAQDSCPMSHESVAVSGRKGRHFIRLWLPLMLEEYWKVTLRDGAKMNSARLRRVDLFCHLFTQRDIATERSGSAAGRAADRPLQPVVRRQRLSPQRLRSMGFSREVCCPSCWASPMRIPSGPRM